MPSAAVDPERLLALSAALTPLRDTARRGADDLLAEFTDLGDRETQLVLDAYLEQAADALREIDAAASDLAGRLRVAAQSAERTVERSVRDDTTAAPRRVFR